MLDLLLNERLMLALVAALAAGTAFWGLWLRARRGSLTREQWLVACGGPWLLLLWGWHELLIRVAGFDSVVTAGLVLLLGLGSGIAAGLWLRRAPKIRP